MSSSVFFRFKSQKEPSRVTFDGTGISVFELKRDIIAQSKLGDGTDFELLISSEDTNEEYDDDTAIIPRSTTIIAKRLPAAKPGRGGAARYVSGKMPQNAKNPQRQEASVSRNVIVASSNGLGDAQSEEDRIAAMLQMGADDWAQQQQQMANAAPVHRSAPMKGKITNVPDHPPPPGYVCYRCGEKGHWIMECPTNNDPAFDGRPRIKRTTGIPKSFLKTVEKPTSLVNDGTVDDAKQPTGVMVNSEGEWVVAEPDQAAWDKYQAQAKTSVAAQSNAAQSDKELQEQGLECPIDKRLFVDPTKTPCCGTTFCHECIQNALLDNDLRCPHCSTDNVPVDDLTPDDDAAAEVRKYEEGKAAGGLDARKQDNNDPVIVQPGGMQRNTDPTLKSPALEPLPLPYPQPGRESRKRPAESHLENSRKPPSPHKGRSNKVQADSPSMSNQPSQADWPDQAGHIPNKARADVAFNPMAFPPMNGFMGMGLPMNMGMQNPMTMMPTAPFMNQGWNNTWAMPAGRGATGTNLNTGASQKSAVYNGGFNQDNLGNPGMMLQRNLEDNSHKVGYGQFANQQRSHNEEESAYFRKPVNPNRQQNRRNWNQNRPADFREI